jgi:hypothetical protein
MDLAGNQGKVMYLFCRRENPGIDALIFSSCIGGLPEKPVDSTGPAAVPAKKPKTPDNWNYSPFP